MKKTRAAALLLAVLVGTGFPAAAAGEEPLSAAEQAAVQAEAAAAAAMAVEEGLPARAALLMEAATGQVLFAQNEREPLPPASVTKVMSLLLVMEALEEGRLAPESEICCSAEAAAMGGSQIWLEEGEIMTVDDLLKAAAVASANDATLALAEAVAGSEAAFVEQMNRRAAQLGMTDTVFKNAVGLDEEGHVTSARDVAVMAAALLEHPQITRYTTLWMTDLREGKTQLVNTNRLVRSYPGAVGLKTGTTDGAGKCLAAAAVRDDLTLVAVVLGCGSSEERFAAGRALLDHGFARYACYLPGPPEEGLASVAVKGGVERRVQPQWEGQQRFVVKKEQLQGLTQRVELADSLQAPVEAGQVIGRVVVEWEGKQLGEYPLRAARGVEKMTLPRAAAMLWHRACAMG